jgi:hypothetical protein
VQISVKPKPNINSLCSQCLRGEVQKAINILQKNYTLTSLNNHAKSILHQNTIKDIQVADKLIPIPE